jgi:hypothetical protein
LVIPETRLASDGFELISTEAGRVDAEVALCLIEPRFELIKRLGKIAGSRRDLRRRHGTA